MKILFIFLLGICFTLNGFDKIYLITIPKSGTYLLQKCIDDLIKFCATEKKGNWDWDIFNPKKNLVLSHLPFTESNAKKLYEFSQLYNIAKFLLIRDPRDQLISFISWGQEKDKLEAYRWWKDYSKLSFDEILLCLICFGDHWYSWDMERFIGYKNRRYGIFEFYNSYLEWLKDKRYNFCIVKFENLVGSEGGGSNESQYYEIKKIAKHLNMNPSDEIIKKIASNLFGNTHTFRKGQIGSYKKYFKKVHTDCFNNIAGQLLIDLDYL